METFTQLTQLEIDKFVYDLEKNFQLLAENMGIDRVSALMKTPA